MMTYRLQNLEWDKTIFLTFNTKSFEFWNGCRVELIWNCTHCWRPSPKQTLRIGLVRQSFSRSAPLWADLSVMCPLLWSESQAAISTTHLFNQATGGGTKGRSVDRSMPPLLFSHPLARPLSGRVLGFVKASVSQWQVDRW